MHVRITDKGRALLNNKELAHKVLSTIINDKDKLEGGEVVPIEGEKFAVRFATTIKEAKGKAKKEDK